MKKLLSLIAAVGLVGTGSFAISNVESCAKKGFNDISKIKAADLKIPADKTGDYKVSTIEQAIVDVINNNVSVDKEGKEVKTGDKTEKVKFLVVDFNFKVGEKDLDESTDFSKDVSVKVTLKSDNAKKLLKGEATFVIEKKSEKLKTLTTDIANNSLEIVAGASRKITVKFAEEDTVTKNVTATSSSADIASVTADKNIVTVAALKVGSTKVTIKAQGYNDLIVDVTVKPVALKTITTNLTNNTLSVKVGTPGEIIVTLQQGDEAITISATSSDETIVGTSVNDKKIAVNGLKAGSVIITVRAQGYKDLVVAVTVAGTE